MEVPQFNFDAVLPAAMAQKAEDVGLKKATMPALNLFLLAILAGAFIGLGANYCTVVVTGCGGVLPYGIIKLLGGLVFCLGLILVVVAGAELFTGNNLIIMGVASGKVTIAQLLYNWVVVYIGNFVGSILTAYFVFLSTQYAMGGGAVGATAVKIANAKCSLQFIPALFLGIYCNALVCLAVWLCFSCRSTTDKILAIIFPISAFVAGGFEHCVANMYFLPIGYFIKGNIDLAKLGINADALTWSNIFLKNLLPVTLGNIIGGAGFVGVIYWLIYRPKKAE